MPDQTGIFALERQLAADAPVISTLTSSWPDSRSAQSSAAAAGPMISTCPADLNSTAGAGSGSGSAAIGDAAPRSSACDFSADQPPSSRMLTKLDARSTRGELAEQRRFLRAGDDDVVAAAERGLERAGVLAAQLVVHGERLARLERRGERLRVERDACGCSCRP